MAQARDISRPQCGYWTLRLARNAPPVPASIQFEQTLWEPGVMWNLCDRSPILTARISGEIVPLAKVWERRGREIDEQTYRFMLADQAWAFANAPHLPEADPTKPVTSETLRNLNPILPPGV
jgi:hypothetical protein